jgi:hypothetical protein
MMKKLKDLNITPGPGAYETNDSSVVSTQYTRKAILDKTSKKNLDGSPSGSGSFTNHNDSVNRMKLKRLNNLSIPTIPSRFLTPVLKFDLHEKDDPNIQTQREMLTRLNNSSGLDGSLASTEHFTGQKFKQPNDGPVESVLVAKVARLTNDGSSLGPGSYNVDQSSKFVSASPRCAIKWQNSKSKR